MNAPRQVELTLRHKLASLDAEIRRLWSGFRALRKTAFWKSVVSGGIGVLEVTINEKTRLWHPHLHLIVDGEFIPQAKLSAEWKKATGDSEIVYVQAVHDRARASKYVSKYLAKSINPTALESREIREYATALHGKRLVFTFGKCAKIKIDPAQVAEKSVGSVHLLLLQRLVDAAARGFRHAEKSLALLAGSCRSMALALGRIETVAETGYVALTESESLLVVKTCEAIAEEGYLRNGGKKPTKRERKRLSRASGLKQSGNLFAGASPHAEAPSRVPAAPGAPLGPPPGGRLLSDGRWPPGVGPRPAACGLGSGPLPPLPPPGPPPEPLPPFGHSGWLGGGGPSPAE